MNRRQKKKAYKKKYGHNPPKTEAKYYGKEWGKIVARAMDGRAEATRAIIPVIRKAVEDMARLARETVTRMQTMPEEDFNSFLENSDMDESAKELARKIRRNGENGLHTGNAKENREGDKAGSAAPGTEDNTGLHGSRTDNTAGNKYGN